MSIHNSNYLVTHALPYANGHLHLGHILGYIQSDIWVRAQKLLGNTCHYISGDDAHGTPIMINARKNNVSPEQFIEQFHQSHLNDFKDFGINFDHFGTTHCVDNKTLVENIYNTIKSKGYIITKNIEQAYDLEAKMFLPDRFIKGECPKCGQDDQYGDSCEHCGATYDPTDLKNPKSILSNTTPVTKQSEHYFFDLPQFTEILQEWLSHDHLQPEIKSKLAEWFETGLKPWDITRDEPYFGFKIPDTENKYFYVWLDAPIGYMSSFKQFCDKNNLEFNDYWTDTPKHKLVHFIGKDITYFHALFWPAILQAADYKKPDHIYVNGFLTVNGKKMSKSRGTFIQARTFLDHLDAEYLRYYFAAKLSRAVEDLDLNLEDFVLRVNADLIGKLVNIASRCAGFINKKFDNKLAADLAIKSDSHEFNNIYHFFISCSDKIMTHYTNLEYSTAVREIMALADKANQYIDFYKPWVLSKSENPDDQLLTHKVCSMGLNLYRILINYLSPIVPKLFHQSLDFLNDKINSDHLHGNMNNWYKLAKPLLNHEIKKFTPLLQRIDPEKIEQILAASKQ